MASKPSRFLFALYVLRVRITLPLLLLPSFRWINLATGLPMSRYWVRDVTFEGLREILAVSKSIKYGSHLDPIIICFRALLNSPWSKPPRSNFHAWSKTAPKTCWSCFLAFGSLRVCIQPGSNVPSMYSITRKLSVVSSTCGPTPSSFAFLSIAASWYIVDLLASVLRILSATLLLSL